MAFKRINFVDLRGIIALVLLMPVTSTTNIDCNGKAFHCVNTTHFMICVDLGSGISSTIDDFVIPCPPRTVCQKTNRFECEFAPVTSPPSPTPLLHVISVQETSAVTSSPTTTTTKSEFTVGVFLEDIYNAVSASTLFDIVTEKPEPLYETSFENNKSAKYTDITLSTEPIFDTTTITIVFDATNAVEESQMTMIDSVIKQNDLNTNINSPATVQNATLNTLYEFQVISTTEAINALSTHEPHDKTLNDSVTTNRFYTETANNKEYTSTDSTTTGITQTNFVRTTIDKSLAINEPSNNGNPQLESRDNKSLFSDNSSITKNGVITETITNSNINTSFYTTNGFINSTTRDSSTTANENITAETTKIDQAAVTTESVPVYFTTENLHEVATVTTSGLHEINIEDSIKQSTGDNIPGYYKQNTTNGIFEDNKTSTLQSTHTSFYTTNVFTNNTSRESSTNANEDITIETTKIDQAAVTTESIPVNFTENLDGFATEVSTATTSFLYEINTEEPIKQNTGDNMPAIFKQNSTNGMFEENITSTLQSTPQTIGENYTLQMTENIIIMASDHEIDLFVNTMATDIAITEDNYIDSANATDILIATENYILDAPTVHEFTFGTNNSTGNKDVVESDILITTEKHNVEASTVQESTFGKNNLTGNEDVLASNILITTENNIVDASTVKESTLGINNSTGNKDVVASDILITTENNIVDASTVKESTLGINIFSGINNFIASDILITSENYDLNAPTDEDFVLGINNSTDNESEIAPDILITTENYIFAASTVQESTLGINHSTGNNSAPNILMTTENNIVDSPTVHESKLGINNTTDFVASDIFITTENHIVGVSTVGINNSTGNKNLVATESLITTENAILYAPAVLSPTRGLAQATTHLSDYINQDSTSTSPATGNFLINEQNSQLSGIHTPLEFVTEHIIINKTNVNIEEHISSRREWTTNSPSDIRLTTLNHVGLYGSEATRKHDSELDISTTEFVPTNISEQLIAQYVSPIKATNHTGSDGDEIGLQNKHFGSTDLNSTTYINAYSNFTNNETEEKSDIAVIIPSEEITSNIPVSTSGIISPPMNDRNLNQITKYITSTTNIYSELKQETTLPKNTDKLIYISDLQESINITEKIYQSDKTTSFPMIDESNASYQYTGTIGENSATTEMYLRTTIENSPTTLNKPASPESFTIKQQLKSNLNGERVYTKSTYSIINTELTTTNAIDDNMYGITSINDLQSNSNTNMQLFTTVSEDPRMYISQATEKMNLQPIKTSTTQDYLLNSINNKPRTDNLIKATTSAYQEISSEHNNDITTEAPVIDLNGNNSSSIKPDNLSMNNLILENDQLDTLSIYNITPEITEIPMLTTEFQESSIAMNSTKQEFLNNYSNNESIAKNIEAEVNKTGLHTVGTEIPTSDDSVLLVESEKQPTSDIIESNTNKIYTSTLNTTAIITDRQSQLVNSIGTQEPTSTSLTENSNIKRFSTPSIDEELVNLTTVSPILNPSHNNQLYLHRQSTSSDDEENVGTDGNSTRSITTESNPKLNTEKSTDESYSTTITMSNESKNKQSPFLQSTDSRPPLQENNETNIVTAVNIGGIYNTMLAANITSDDISELGNIKTQVSTSSVMPGQTTTLTPTSSTDNKRVQHNLTIPNETGHSKINITVGRQGHNSYTTSTTSNYNTNLNAKRVTTANESQFSCLNYGRGRYGDNKECRKFYICVGRYQPVVGMCPINTVFSEIRKQCTKDLSHCIRNNQFLCTSDGRFVDYHNESVYYICMRNTSNTFSRFKLQCTNGYYLNKTSVKCILKPKDKSQFSSATLSTPKSSNSDSTSTSEQIKTDIRKESQKKSREKFECDEEGKFVDPHNCRKYYHCYKNKNDEFRMKKKKCDSEEVFDEDMQKCSETSSRGC